jgi:hypothetical protein
MKVYNLRCEHDHRFEGWFSSEQDYCDQTEQKRIACPVCESSTVNRLPSAPRLNLSTAQATPSDANLRLQAQILDMVRKVVAETEDVGERFAEEARRIHYKETPERAIRGTATVHECEALIEEGVDVIPLPFAQALKHPVQ